jgi:hypothetical protein
MPPKKTSFGHSEPFCTANRAADPNVIAGQGRLALTRSGGHEMSKWPQTGSLGLSAAIVATAMVLIGGCASSGSRPESSTSASGSPSAAIGGTLYVTNSGDATVSVINGATCNADDTSGCRQKAATVRVGAFPTAVVVDPVTNMVFVANQDTHPGTVSVIDGNSCNAAQASGCKARPGTITVGSAPSWTVVNRPLETVYVVVQSTNSVAVLGD